MRKAFAFGALLISFAAAGAFLVAQRRRGQQAATQSATVVETVRRVMKLATVEMTVSDWRLRRDSKNLFGFIPIACEKTVAVFFRGTVSAGFDFQAAPPTTLAVHTDERSRVVAVDLPAPRLLYTDVPAPEFLITDGSLCNRIEAQDYARMHEEARRAVQEEALARGILERAETRAREILTEVVRPLGYSAQVRVAPPAPLMASPAP